MISKKEQIVKLLGEGVPIPEIVRTVNTSRTYVYQMAQILGISQKGRVSFLDFRGLLRKHCQ
jgi:hypothetical protein